jgi:hypothetical protein
MTHEIYTLDLLNDARVSRRILLVCGRLKVALDLLRRPRHLFILQNIFLPLVDLIVARSVRLSVAQRLVAVFRSGVSWSFILDVSVRLFEVPRENIRDCHGQHCQQH